MVWRWVFAKSPPVHIRNVHLINKEGPRDLHASLVTSLWKFDRVVELQCSVQICEFIIAIIDTGRNDLFKPWLVAIESSEAKHSQSPAVMGRSHTYISNGSCGFIERVS